MAEATEFTIGARAQCSDGFCGEVSRLVIDPAARTVTHLVIQAKHRGEPGRLVPLDLVESADNDIMLRCTVAEFDSLEPAEEADLVEDIGYAAATEPMVGFPDYGNMAVGGSVSGLGAGAGYHVRTVTHDVVPLGDAEVGRGEHVHALDGQIGRVQGFLVSADNQVTHVLLEEGHLWGRKEVAIPISAVTGVDDGIRLSITKKQVEDLPPAN